jgi:hypothetical protein
MKIVTDEHVFGSVMTAYAYWVDDTAKRASSKRDSTASDDSILAASRSHMAHVYLLPG